MKLNKLSESLELVLSSQMHREKFWVKCVVLSFLGHGVLGFVKHSTGIQRFGQLLCQVRRFGTSWYNSKDNVGENSNLVWQPFSLEQVAYAIGLSTTFYRPYIDYAHFSSSRTVWHVNQKICVIKLVWSYRSVSHPHISGLVQRRPKPRKLCRRTALASLANSIVIAVAPSTRMQFSANVRHKRHTSNAYNMFFFKSKGLSGFFQLHKPLMILIHIHCHMRLKP